MSQISVQDIDTKLDGIEANANNYSHPTGAGNNHIPSGGSVGQILENTASGTVAWAASPSVSTTAGDVGTYAAAWQSGNGSQSFGSTLSGSSLRAGNFFDMSGEFGHGTTSFSGTWRCMGHTGVYNYFGSNTNDSNKWFSGTIWVRIS